MSQIDVQAFLHLWGLGCTFMESLVLAIKSEGGDAVRCLDRCATDHALIVRVAKAVMGVAQSHPTLVDGAKMPSVLLEDLSCAGWRIDASRLLSGDWVSQPFLPQGQTRGIVARVGIELYYFAQELSDQQIIQQLLDIGRRPAHPRECFAFGAQHVPLTQGCRLLCASSFWTDRQERSYALLLDASHQERCIRLEEVRGSTRVLPADIWVPAVRDQDHGRVPWLPAPPP